MSALHDRVRRARRLSREQLTQECIDYLQNPQVLASEFAEAFESAAQRPAPQEKFDSKAPAGGAERTRAGRGLARLSSAPFVRIEALLEPDEYDFSCVATDLLPSEEAAAQDVSLDYVALSCDLSSTPILGAIDDSEASASFVPLLHLLAGLAEIGTEAQRARANRQLFRGALDPRSPFDLHILSLSEPGDRPPALAQLTQDLAFIFVDRLRGTAAFPALIRNVLFLSLPARCDSAELSLIEHWRV